MIQDFSNTFSGKQIVKVKSVKLKKNGLFKKIVGIFLTSTLAVGILACLVFGLLIRSGLNELADKQVTKFDLIKDQQVLYQERNELLSKEKIEAIAGTMGLYDPLSRQIKRL